MNLSPELQHEIERIAAIQGLSPEQFIVQTLNEKIRSLKQQPNTPKTAPIASSQHNPQLKKKDGILVIETIPLDDIDFNDVINQLRTECDQEQMHL